MYSPYEIVAWLNIQEKSIKDKPPLEAVRRGLLAREKFPEGELYRSTLVEYLTKEFSDVEQEQFLVRLFQ